MALHLQLLVATSIWAVLIVAASLSTIYRFPSGSWVENLAVRSNGKILVVLFSQPEVYEINPFRHPPTAELIARFDNAIGVQGIAELEDGLDVFAVMPLTGSTYSLWTVDVRAWDDGRRETVKSEVIKRIEGVGLLNGLTRFTESELLASDSNMGTVVSLNITSRTSSVVLKDETMLGIPLIGAGINGLREHSGNLYYTNLFKGIVCRIPIDSLDAIQSGPVQIIGSGLGLLDDLAVGDDNSIYVAQYLSGSVARLDQNGSVQTVAQGLDQPTSAQFGRTVEDRNILYVSSSGNPLGVIFRGAFDGGKVYAIDMS